MNTPFIQAQGNSRGFLCNNYTKKKVITWYAFNDSDYSCLVVLLCNLIVDFEFDKIDEESKIKY